MIRRLLLVPFALILSWAGVGQHGVGALALPAEVVHVYAHDVHRHTAAPTLTTTERGPPAGYGSLTGYDPNGMLPSGDLARPEVTTTPATNAYDDVHGFVQTARRSWVAEEGTGSPSGELALAPRASVAAKYGDDAIEGA